MASGFTLANRIRKRMALPPLDFLLAILPQFYRFSNSHKNLGFLQLTALLLIGAEARRVHCPSCAQPPSAQ